MLARLERLQAKAQCALGRQAQPVAGGAAAATFTTKWPALEELAALCGCGGKPTAAGAPQQQQWSIGAGCCHNHCQASPALVLAEPSCEGVEALPSPARRAQAAPLPV